MAQTQSKERSLGDLVFIGLNKRVIALDRYSGEVAWDWKAPEGTGFVALMLDGDRLIASVNGYVYCLDPLFGQEVWRNPLKGFGVGVTSVTSIRGASHQSPHAQKAADDQQAAATAAG